MKHSLITIFLMLLPFFSFSQSTEIYDGDKWAYMWVKKGDDRAVFVDFVKYLIGKGIVVDKKDMDFYTFETSPIDVKYAKYKMQGSLQKNDTANCTIWIKFVWDISSAARTDWTGHNTAGQYDEWIYKSNKLRNHYLVYESFQPILSAYPNKENLMYRAERR
jgi:hypothetical protein